MAKIITTLALIGLSFLSSCQKSQESVINSSKTIELVKSEMVLEHDELLLSTPAIMSKSIGRDSVLIYDDRSQTLVLFDLNSKIPIWHNKFDLEGPSFLDRPVFDIGIIGKSVVVLSLNYLSVFNTEGEVISRLSNRDIQGLNSKFIMQKFENVSDNNLILTKSLFSVLGPSNARDTLESIFMKINLESSAIKDLEITSPSETLVSNPKLGFYNNFAEHSITFLDSIIVFNFQFSSKVYKYNLDDKSLKVYPANSNLSSNMREPLPNDYTTSSLMEYMYTGPRFYKVHYDPVSQLYFRHHLDIVEDTNNNPISKKFLMVFDRNFEKLMEFEIDERISTDIFINDGKIYMWKSISATESNYNLISYEIQKK